MWPVKTERICGRKKKASYVSVLRGTFFLPFEQEALHFYFALSLHIVYVPSTSWQVPCAWEQGCLWGTPFIFQFIPTCSGSLRSLGNSWCVCEGEIIYAPTALERLDPYSCYFIHYISLVLARLCHFSLCSQSTWWALLGHFLSYVDMILCFYFLAEPLSRFWMMKTRNQYHSSWHIRPWT